MKRSVLYGLLTAALAMTILWVGIAMPRVLLRRQEEAWFRSSFGQPIEEVHPYGEDYEEFKSRLSQEMMARYYSPASEALALDDSQWDDVSFAYFQEFWDAWASLCPYIESDWVPEEEQRCRMIGEDEEPIGLSTLSWYSKSLGMYDNFCFEEATGTPIVLNIMLEAGEDLTVGEFCETLRAVYEQHCGLSFQPFNLNDWGSLEADPAGGFLELDAMKLPDGYGYIAVDAISADQVFRLDISITNEYNLWMATIELSLNR